MASIRRNNFLGQQRVDAPHLRLLESQVAGDFDALAGLVLCGDAPQIVSGFEVSNPAQAVGRAATELTLLVAGARILHPGATASGTVHVVPADRAPEILNTANSRVEGAFTAGSTCYVGLDLRRAADPATADDVAFLDASDVPEEFVRRVPLALVSDYKIVVSTVDFGATPTVCPVAVVVVDGAGLITSVTDARPRFLRLASGGSSPSNTWAYPWPQGRTESASNSFRGGDKALSSVKDWLNATMTRVWELGGGERWFSAVSPVNVKMTRSGAVFANGEYFEWDGTHLHWKGLRFVFPNSTGWYNDVANQTANSAGLTDLADGECVYVDLDFSANRTGGTALVAAKASSTLLGSPAMPGSRYVIAWRVGSAVWSRDQAWSTGTHFIPATTTSLGVVKLSKTPTDAANPIVLTNTERDAANGVAGLNGSSVVLGAGLRRSGSSGSLVIGSGTSSDQAVELIGNSSYAFDAAVFTNDDNSYAQLKGGSSFQARCAGTARLSVSTFGDVTDSRFNFVTGLISKEETITAGSNGFSSVDFFGTGTGSLTPSGKCGGLGYLFIAKITTAGDKTAAQFQFSRNGGKDWNGAGISTNAPHTDATSGVVFTWGAGNYALDDRYAFTPRFQPQQVHRSAGGQIRGVFDHNGFHLPRIVRFAEHWLDDGWSSATSIATPSKWIGSFAASTAITCNNAGATIPAPHLRMFTSAGSQNANDETHIRTSNKLLYVADHVLAALQAEVLVDTGAVVGAIFQIGFRDAGGATAAGMYFEKPAAASAWTCNAVGGATTSVSTGLTSAGEAGGGGTTAARLRLEVLGATLGGGNRTARFWIDEVLVAEITTNVGQGPYAVAIGCKASANGAVFDAKVAPIDATIAFHSAAPAL